MGVPDEYPAMTEVTVLMEDLGGRTKVIMTHADVPVDSGANEGWGQAFDKLGDHVDAVLKDQLKCGQVKSDPRHSIILNP